MRWLGLDARALALVALAASAWIVWLYLRARPARRVLVPSLALFAAGTPRRSSGARVQRLFSVLLALVITALMVLALAEPERIASARNLVLLIDCSPSMAARDVTPNRFEASKRAARERVEQLGPNDHAWVIALSDAAIPRTPRSDDHAVLRSAIDSLQLSSEPADLAAGIALGRDLLAPYPGGELVLFSDESAPSNVALQHVPIGTSTRNVAISALAVRPYLLDHAHQEVLVALSNFGTEPEPLRWSLWAGDALLREEQLELAAGATVTRTLADLPTSDANVRAELTLDRGPDVLPDDDRAELRSKPRPRTRVLAVTHDDRYLEAALLLDDALEVRETDRYRSSEGYDLVIFDGVLPSEPPGIPALYFAPPADGAFPLARRGELTRPNFARSERDHPLTHELALTDVNVARAQRLVLAPGDLAIAESTSHDPLIVTGERAGQAFIAFAFDLRESDLPLRAAFPLLFLRALESLRAPRLASEVSAVARVPAESVLHAAQGALAKAPPPARSLRIWPLLVAAALALLLLERATRRRGWTA